MDRDDTLMVDVKYCDNPDLVQLIPGSAEGIRSMRDAGYRIVVITNQSGVGRGYFTLETLAKVNDRLRRELRHKGADYDALYFCPHTPEDGCDCRKPKPGLLLRAASEMEIDLACSFAIGDRDLDVEAGKAAGTRTILVSNGDTSDNSGFPKADFVVSNLKEAARLIRSQSKGRDGRGAQRSRPRS